MSETGRMVVFLAVALSIWTALHLYVFWRLAKAPLVADHLLRGWLLAIAALLWLTYPLAQTLNRQGLEALGYPLELVGAVWMGTLFLAFLAVLLVDLANVTLLAANTLLEGIGLAVPALGRSAPLGAVAVAVLLSAIGVVQAARGPVVVHHQVTLAGLPQERDGTVVTAVSDLHLGSLLGRRWLERRITQVEAQRPDLVAVVGDLVDGNAKRVERLLPELRRLRAPLGVWAVTGNHEYYAGLDASVRLMEEAGFSVLRDGWTEVAPGLIVAGVDDFTARKQFTPPGTPAMPFLAGRLDAALADRPAAATLLLSHTPWLAERAAAAGVALMLSGHTHDGQIWPFGYLVTFVYPYLGGAYEVGGMRLIVCRGTGTWGPPVRLWRRSEILVVTLRSATG